MKQVLGVLSVALLIFLSIGLLSFYVLSDSNQPPNSSLPPATETPPAEYKNTEFPDTGFESVISDSFVAPVSGNDGPRVAIVIDDLGWVISTAKIYDRLDADLTMALLPGRPRSEALYHRWKDRFQFIVHMPMEPLGYPEDDPGDLALYTTMDESEIEQRLQRILQRYPAVVGLNNHMGSAFTQNRYGMKTVMKFLRKQNLFYLDSGTSASSVALQQARRHHVPMRQNQVFLDHRREAEFIRAQLKRLVKIARNNGTSIGIGHIQSNLTARILAEEIPGYQAKGIQFVTLSSVMPAVAKATLPSPESKQ